MRGDECARQRIGQGVAAALTHAFPANDGEAIASLYPPDAAGDDRLDDLIARLRRIPLARP